MAERLRIFGKLFSLFPQREAVELSIESYVDETIRIPCSWLRGACKRLTLERGRKFCPSISELHGTLATMNREFRNRQRGIDLDEYSPVCRPPPTVVQREVRRIEDRFTQALEANVERPERLLRELPNARHLVRAALPAVTG